MIADRSRHPAGAQWAYGGADRRFCGGFERDCGGCGRLEHRGGCAPARRHWRLRLPGNALAGSVRCRRRTSLQLPRVRVKSVDIAEADQARFQIEFLTVDCLLFANYLVFFL